MGDLKRSFKSFLANISVEPCYLFYTLTVGLGMIVTQELYIQKVCQVNLNMTVEVCEDLQRRQEEQDQVQEYVANLKIYRRTLGVIPAVIFTLAAGPWSDRHGRRPIIVLATVGQLAANLNYLVCSHFFKELRAEFLLLEMVENCLGGTQCFIMALYAYVADVTESGNRTKRMAFLAGIWALGTAVGKNLGALIKERFGYVANFAVGCSFPVLSVLYATCRLKESRAVQTRSRGPESETTGRAGEAWRAKLRGYKNLLLGGCRAALANRSHKGRALLLAVIFCYGVEVSINTGDRDFSYLYLRKRLDFTLTDFTLYRTACSGFSVATQFVFVPFLSRRCCSIVRVHII